MSSLFFPKTLVVSVDGINPVAILPGPPPAPQAYDGSYTITGNGALAYSVPMLVQNKDTIGLQVSCLNTGTPNGTFSIQVSNDVSTQETNDLPDGSLIHWATCSFWDESTGLWVTSKAISGVPAGGFPSGGTSLMASIQVLSARWWRMLWTNTTGSVNLIAKAAIKADGGR